MSVMGDVLGVGKVVEKLVEPIADIIKKVAGPAAEEIGLTLQDSIKVYRAKRQYRLFEKMRDFVKEAGYEPRHIPLKILLPSMDYASVEEDEDLHTAWATLLANAADPNVESVSPAFPEILRQMSPHEARLLSQASRYPLRWQGTSWETLADRVVRHRYDRENMFNQWVDAGCSKSGKHYITIAEGATELGPLYEDDERRFDLALENLIRLGVVAVEDRLEIPVPDTEATSQAQYQQGMKLKHSTERLFHVSAFGFEFVTMCTVTPQERKSK